MTKNEIKECINSTIVSNDDKGITAESLNLILNEIVDNSGEGGNGGDNNGDRTFVFQYPVIIAGKVANGSEAMIDSIWSRNTYTAILDAMSELWEEEGFEEDYQDSSLHKAFMDSFDYNDNVFKELQEYYQNGNRTANIKLDISLGMDIMFETMGSEMYQYTLPFLNVQTYSVSNIVDDTQITQWVVSASITLIDIPIHFAVTNFSAEECIIAMEPYSFDDTTTVYVNNESETYKQYNKDVIYSWNIGYTCLQLYLDFNDGSDDKTVGIFGTQVTSSSFSTYFMDGLVMNKLEINSEGMASITPIGSLSPITE